MRSSVLLAIIALIIGACGSSTGDRAASGAGIGAGTGAVIGAVTDLSILEGVVVGGIVGGVLGGVSDEDQIDLGDPTWVRGDTSANDPAVRRVQAGLDGLGYSAGPVNGVQGAQTTDAIIAYQRDHRLTADGRATISLARHIEDQPGSG